MDIYYSKYIKYKDKYINLKNNINLNGGMRKKKIFEKNHHIMI